MTLLAAVALWVGLAADPGAAGPLAVSVAEYDLGDAAFQPSDFDAPVEIRAVVHYPAGLPGGPYPLVLLLHGRHPSCHDGIDLFLNWPCQAPAVPIPSYRGFDYVAEILASHGFVVVSVSANGITAQDGIADLGALARAELLQAHLDLWNGFGTVGGAPFGATFVGKVDLERVGVLGHSRGGEGAVRQVLLNRALGSPYGIRAVFALAPLDSQRLPINDVPFAVLLPYCDGDVSSLEGASYFDDSRYNVPGDRAPKHSILVLGANHNYYNTVWTPSLFPAGARDDWADWGGEDAHCGPGEPNDRLADAEQRGTGIAYPSAFFRTYLGGESAFLRFLVSGPPPPSARTEGVHVTYHPPDDPALRRDLNRLLEPGSLATNVLGGAAHGSGLIPSDLCGGAGQTRCLPGTMLEAKEPHSALDSWRPGMSQFRVGWDDRTATWTNEMPPGSRDFGAHASLQFRAAVNFADPRNAGQPQDLSVTLVDGAGVTSSVQVSRHTRALFHPPGSPPGSPPGRRDFNVVPRTMLNTVRVPLDAFSGVFLQDIRTVRLDFDREPSGALLLSDLMLADAAEDRPPIVRCSTGAPVLPAAHPQLLPVRLEVTAADDLEPDVPVQVRVFSDEDDGKSPDASDLAQATLRLRAERDPGGDGRVFVVVATAEDDAGHVGYGCCTATVPHDRSAASLASARTQASAAQDRCIAFAARATGRAGVPAGYFEVGER
jgi:hypothetical protein